MGEMGDDGGYGEEICWIRGYIVGSRHTSILLSIFGNKSVEGRGGGCCLTCGGLRTRLF